MLGITGAVLSGILAAFFLLWRRYRAHMKTFSHTFVNEEGQLMNNDKGIVEWNNY